MSDKKLLEEGTVRRFMELANIKPLNTLSEAAKKPAAKPAAEEPAAKDPAAKEPAGGKGRKGLKENERPGVTFMREDDPNATSGVMHEEEAMGDMSAVGGEAGGMGGGEEAGVEGGEGLKPAVQKIIDGLNELLADSGLEVDMEKEEGGEGEEAPEAGEEEEEEEEEEGTVYEKKEMEEGYGKKKMEEKKKMKPAEEEKMEEDLQLEELQVEDDEALAEELTRRVAARLVAEMKKAKKGMTEGGSWGAPPKTKGKAAPKGHGPSKKPFGAKGKGR